MNTIQTFSYRRKYRLKSLDKLLRKALVAEKICNVDRTEGKYIDSPYGSQPSVTIQSIAGTYTPAAYTLTDDTLTVTDEFIVSEHIYDFEQVLTSFDVMASRMDEQNYQVATNIDKFVLNNLCEDATTTYSTPAGGFTTPANINVIMSNLISKVAGYSEMYKGMYLVIENTDVPGFIQAQAANGFSFADAALRNGFMTNYMGVAVHVVRTGTFVDATLGTTTVTNSGHRVFGIKNTATYAAPRGIQYEEKAVTKKTGRETVTWGYIGFKLWASKKALTVDITIT
jgi:hypothetical protein